MYHDETSSIDDMLRDISDKHCPDSVRHTAYAELERRGVDHRAAQKLADEKYGDFWG